MRLSGVLVCLEDVLRAAQFGVSAPWTWPDVEGRIWALEYLLRSETTATAETDTLGREVTVYMPTDWSSILSRDSNVKL